jgi:hypothetical protein
MQQIMNAEQFINVIKEVVSEGSVKGVQSSLINPPGRKPSENLVEMSEWYNNLNDGSKSMVIKIIRESVELGIFSFLCVLDGVSAIENGPEKGVLKLIFDRNGQQILINDPKQDFLHDLFNAV